MEIFLKLIYIECQTSDIPLIGIQDIITRLGMYFASSRINMSKILHLPNTFLIDCFVGLTGFGHLMDNLRHNDESSDIEGLSDRAANWLFHSKIMLVAISVTSRSVSIFAIFF